MKKTSLGPRSIATARLQKTSGETKVATQNKAAKPAPTSTPQTQADGFDASSSTVDVAQVPSSGAKVDAQSSPALARLQALQGAPVGQVAAAIDLGSSSAKMLVMRQGADGSWSKLRDLKIGCALGKGVQNGAAIPDANQARTKAALKELLDEAAGFGIAPDAVPLITTAVMRNASNGAAFLSELQQDLGLAQARILSGEEEATVGFLGAVSDVLGGLPDDAKLASIDLGGGSFQLAIGTKGGVDDAGSTQVGSNAVLDDMLKKGPTYDAASGVFGKADFDHVDAQLQKTAPMPLDDDLLDGRQLVATGGVSKFLAAHTGSQTVSRDAIDELRRALGAMPEDHRAQFIRMGKDDAMQDALGISSTDKAVAYGRKLPASMSLLLHILDSLGLDEVKVSTSDARHHLVLQAGA